MNLMNRFTWGFLLVAFFAKAATIEEISPLGGAPGTVVTLTGSGFDELSPASVDLNGTGASLAMLSATQAQFTVPDGATSGLLALSNGAIGPYPFEVRREVVVSLALPSGLSHRYTVATGTAEAEPAGDAFAVEVASERPSIVWAIPDTDEERAPFFATVVLPSETSDAIDARSTAATVAYLTPALVTRDADRAATTMAALESSNDIATAAAMIELAADAGHDFLDDIRFEDAMVAAVQGVLTDNMAQIQSAAAASKSKTEKISPLQTTPPDTRGLRIEELDPDVFLTKTRLELVPVNLDEALGDPAGTHADSHLVRLKVKDGETNPVDWIVEVYEIHPRSIPGGISTLENIEPRDALEFLDPVPIFAGHVGASLASENIDILGQLAGFIQKAINGLGDPRLGRNDFVFERDDQAIYVIQAYSGNLFYGTGFFLAPDVNQVELLDSVDLNDQWTNALITNIVIADFEVIYVAVDFKDFLSGPDALVDLVSGVFNSVSKVVATYNEQEGLTREIVLEMVKAAQKSALQGLTTQLTEGGVTATTSRLLKGAGKTLLKAFDIFGKVSNAEQALERSAGLVAPNAYAIERNLVVLNNPWIPEIRSFNPRRGQGGQEITIFGFGFGYPQEDVPDGEENDDIRVSLCRFPSTLPPGEEPGPDNIQARVDLEIVERRDGRITARLPEDFIDTLPTGGNVCVETSAGLAVGDVFEAIPPPSLLSITPQEAFRWSTFSLSGENIPSDAVAVINGSLERQPVRVTPSSLTFFLPPDNFPLGEHTVRIRAGERETEDLTFTVKEVTPTVGDQNPGVIITVTITEDIVAEDAEMSLREAILIANGSRGATLSRHLACELLPPSDDLSCPFVERDIDLVTNDDENGRIGGPTQVDTIRFRVADDVVFTVNSPLPPLGPWDTIDFGGRTVNATGQATGLILDGAREATLRNVTITGGSEAGLRITEGSDRLMATNLTISNCGAGLTVDSSEGPSFFGLNISNTTSHGIHLSGDCEGVRLNNAILEDVGENGLFLEDGPSQTSVEILEVRRAGGHGAHLTGEGTRFNRSFTSASFGDDGAAFTRRDIFHECGGYGLLIDGGASNNFWAPRQLFENALGGACIAGENTSFNFIGKIYLGRPRLSFLPSLSYFNGGPGISISNGAHNNVISSFNIVANQGDGVIIDNAHDNVLINIETGVQRFFFDDTMFDSPPPAPNKGSSVRMQNGASGNLLRGTGFISMFGDSVFQSSLRNDEVNGLVITGEGTDHNQVIDTVIENIGAVASIGEPLPPADQGNGIVIRDGASGNTVGNARFRGRVNIMNVAGAGVLIDGPETMGNVIGGAFTEWEEDAPIHDSDWAGCGIYLRDGTHSNRIGVPGPEIGTNGINPFPSTVTNRFNARRYGMVFDGAGGRIVDGERIEENLINENSASGMVGLMIRGGAEVNTFGGPVSVPAGFFNAFEPPAADGNSFSGSVAGVQFDTTPLSEPAARNRFLNNFIAGQWNPPFGAPIDPIPSISPDANVAILFSGESHGHVFGETLATSNVLGSNLVGVYVDGVDGLEIRGLDANQFAFNGFLANVVLDEAENVLLGGRNQSFRNEFYLTGLAASNANVVIIGGGGHRLLGNRIEGVDGMDVFGSGIVVEGASGLQIGGAGAQDGNIIVGHQGDGIRIAGETSTGNTIQGNWIGVEPDGTITPNLGHGLRLEDANSGNLLGGTGLLPGGLRVDAPNIIANNEGYGVSVSGFGSMENRLTGNSIYANMMGGIELDSGGNLEVPAPTAITYAAGTASGEVALSIPNGSTVEIFSDEAEQGEIFLASATTSGTTFAVTGLPPAPLANITATVTSPDGNTSPFGMGTLDQGFQVRRADGAMPRERNVPDANQLAVLALIPEAVGADVALQMIEFRASGTVNDATEITGVALFNDGDFSGTLTDADELLAEASPVFEENDGTVTLDIGGRVIPGDQPPPQWLLVFTGNPPEGRTLQVEIESATAVAASILTAPGLSVTTGGVFPVESDLLIFTEEQALAFAAWQTDEFGDDAGNPAIAGPLADPDGDGIPNALEFALGLDPNVPNAPGEAFRTNRSGGMLTLSVTRPNDRAGVNFFAAASENLGTGFDRGSAMIEAVSNPVDNGDGTSTTTVSVREPSTGVIFVRFEAEIAP